MKIETAQSALSRKKRSMMIVRLVAVALLAGSAVVLWSDPAFLGAVAGAILLLTVTGFYLVEHRYAVASEQLLTAAQRHADP